MFDELFRIFLGYFLILFIMISPWFTWFYRNSRFDPKEGRKKPCQDVLDRFKRLNNGMWIRARMGRNIKRYSKDETFLKVTLLNLYFLCWQTKTSSYNRWLSSVYDRKYFFLSKQFWIVNEEWILMLHSVSHV